MKHFKEVASKLTNESEVVGFVPPVDMPCPNCNGTGRVKLPPCEEVA
jgi:DnaJ-class molecular chaperone